METLGTGRPLEIGVPAPDFTLTMMDTARPVSLADYRGKTPLPLVCTEDSIVRSVDARSRHLARSPTAFGPSVSGRGQRYWRGPMASHRLTPTETTGNAPGTNLLASF